jgi:hypothetical protein
MAGDQRIIDLPAAAPLDGTELLYAAQGANDVKVLAAALRAAAQVGQPGQCRLELVGGSIRLNPFNGNVLTVGGQVQTIPDAGVALPASGLTTNTNYFVYAFMSGGTLTLEPSTTAPAVQAGTGLMIKSGDPSRALVGYVRAAGATSYFTASGQIRSWFNEKPIGMSTSQSITLTSPGSWYEMTSTRISFLSWAFDYWHFDWMGFIGSSTLGEAMQVAIGLNGSIVSLTSLVNQSSPESYWSCSAGNIVLGPGQGWHYVSLYLLCSDTGGFNAQLQHSGHRIA